MRYRVNTTCQFRNRLYEKGEVIDLPAEVETPPYFDALEEAAPHEEAMPVTDVPTTGKRGRRK